MNILFIRLDHIGDCFLTLPAIKEFRRQYPESHISVLCKKNTAFLFKNSGLIDKIYTFNVFFSVNPYEYKDGYFKTLLKILKLRKKKFDYIYNFQPNKKISFLMHLFNGKKKFYNNGISLYEGNKHVIFNNKYFLSKAFDYISDEKIEYVQIGKKKINLNVENSYIFHIGGSYMKKFSDEKIRCIYNYFNKKGVKFYLAGSIFDNYKYKDDKFITIKNMYDWINLCENNNKIICFDSGPMHIASAYSKNILVLFGPTSVKYFGPLNYRHVYKSSKYKEDFVPGNIFSYDRYKDFLQRVSVFTVIGKIKKYLM